MTTWDLSGTKHHVFFICNGACCKRQGADEVTLAIRDEIHKWGADPLIHTTRTLCQGSCDNSCVVTVYPAGVWYKQVTPELGRSIVSRHLIEGSPISNQTIYNYEEGFVLKDMSLKGLKKGSGKQS